jgi:hypothetical protein
MKPDKRTRGEAGRRNDRIRDLDQASGEGHELDNEVADRIKGGVDNTQTKAGGSSDQGRRGG